MSTKRTNEDPSTSYISSNERTVGIRPLHSGPIHALCAVDSSHLASGGGDQVWCNMTSPVSLSYNTFNSNSSCMSGTDMQLNKNG